MVISRNGRRENRLLASMGPADRTLLEPFIQRVEMTRGQQLAVRGETITHVYFPVDCVTSTLMELVDGESVEVGLMGTEGVTGLSLLYGLTESNTSVIVQIPGCADRLDAAVFARDVVERTGPFYQLLLRYANAFMEMIAQVAACNASHSVEQRCGRWILLAADRVPSDIIPLTHEYLSLMLGVRRASVSGAVNLLRLAGAVEFTRGQVKIIDRHKLLQASCPCYLAMVDTMENLFRPRPQAFAARS